jgi:hypothetical protein
MKTKKLSIFGIAGITALIMAGAPYANASDSQPKDEKCYSGTVTAVDTNDNMLTVHGYLFSRHFVLANDCKLAEPDKNRASLADLRPGERVDVHYKAANGIRVANHINAEEMRFTGTVEVFDVNQHTLTVHRRGLNRTFTLADNCRVLGNGDRKEASNNIHWGDQVTVVYELPQNRTIAREVDLPGKVITGSLDNINMADQTVNVGKEKFYIGDHCVIIANDNFNARMDDLRMGRNYALTYETVGGINIVNRIGPAESTAQPTSKTAQYLPPH